MNWEIFQMCTKEISLFLGRGSNGLQSVPYKYTVAFGILQVLQLIIESASHRTVIHLKLPDHAKFPGLRCN